MATKTIGTGKNFTSTSSWLTYLNALGTLAAPEVAQFDNSSTWGDKLVISGITTSATNTLTLQAYPGDENKGVVGAGTSFATTSGGSWGAFVIENGCQHVIVQDLQFNGGGASSENILITSGTMTMAGDAFIIIERCIVHNGTGIWNGSANIFPTVTIRNNIYYDCVAVTGAIQGYSANISNTLAYFNTFIKNSPYVAATNPAGVRYVLAKNNAVLNFGGTSGWADYLNSDAASDYNASHDTTAPGTHSIHSLTDSDQFTGVGDGSWDFAPKATAAIVGAGTPISGITTDIAGNTRSATTPTIGAFEYVAAGGTSHSQTLTDTVTVADTLIRSTTHVLSEAITNAPTIIRSTSRALADAITNSDTISHLRALAKALSESLTHTDTLVRATTRNLTEAITNTASLAKTTLRSLIEAITNSDVFSHVNTPSGIAFDNKIDGGISSSAATSFSYSFTVGTGANRILFVGAWGATTDVLTGATYGGISMVLVGKVQCPSDRWVYLWYLTNPASGANNVVISSSTGTSISSQAASYTGAAQTGQPDSSNTITGTIQQNWSASLTTVADNSWTIAFMRESLGSATTVNTGTTILEDNPNGTHLYDSTSAVNPAGSTSLSGLISRGTANIGIVAASFAPAAAANLTKALTEAITHTDILIRSTTRSLIEAIASSDALSKLRTLLKSLTETISQTDTLARSTVRSLTEAITNASSLAKTSTRLLTQSLTATDTLIRKAAKSFLEIITQTATFSGAAQLLKTLSETISHTDTLLKTTARKLAETITQSDTFTHTVFIGKVLLETISAADTLVRSLTRSLAEKITTSVAFATAGFILKTLTEAITASDALSHARTTLKTLQELISHTETMVRSITRKFSESVTNSSSLLKTPLKVLSDTLTSSATFSRTFTAVRTLIEIISPADVLTKLLNGTVIKWEHITKSAAATWTHINTSTTATWTKITKAADAVWSHISQSQ